MQNSNILKKLKNICGMVKLEYTTKELMGEVDKKGTITGSYAFNVHSEKSDIDIILPSNFKYSWNDIYRDHNGYYLHENKDEFIPHYQEYDFESIYVLNKNKVLNLLLMCNTKEYNRWIYATQKMITEIQNKDFKDKIKDKFFRIEYFEKFKNEYV